MEKFSVRRHLFNIYGRVPSASKFSTMEKPPGERILNISSYHNIKRNYKWLKSTICHSLINQQSYKWPVVVYFLLKYYNVVQQYTELNSFCQPFCFHRLLVLLVLIDRIEYNIIKIMALQGHPETLMSPRQNLSLIPLNELAYTTIHTQQHNFITVLLVLLILGTFHLEA